MAARRPATSPDPTRAHQRRALVVVLVANAAFMVVEFAGGLLFESLALLADAAHMLSDVVALTVALAAHQLATRPPSRRHSYGLQRAEVLGAQANAVLLLAAAAWVFFEAFRRLDQPFEVEGPGLIAVASAGLVVNLVSAGVLVRVRSRSLNMRGAVLHMLTDAAGSVAALSAGVAVVAWGADAVDPLASMLIAVLVVFAATQLLRESAHVLLEGTPPGIDPIAVTSAIEGVEGIEAVHHLHVWNLASDVPALSAHVVIEGEISLHEAQQRAMTVKERLAERFGIAHATLEIECHECPDPEVSPEGATPEGATPDGAGAE